MIYESEILPEIAPDLVDLTEGDGPQPQQGQAQQNS
jgi:hypothetical protein